LLYPKFGKKMQSTSIIGEFFWRWSVAGCYAMAEAASWPCEGGYFHADRADANVARSMKKAASEEAAKYGDRVEAYRSGKS
jgi:hypothetical protein